MEGESERKLYEKVVDGEKEAAGNSLEVLLESEPFLLNEVALTSCNGKTPLHIAAAEGYVKAASTLLSKAPKMCWSRDLSGMNPIHVAAMHGSLEVLQTLLRSDQYFAAMERLDRGETVMHLCAKHQQLESLKILVDKLGEFVCAEDDDGETVLHLAVRLKLVDMVDYLISETRIDKKSKDSRGRKPKKILNEAISYLELTDEKKHKNEPTTKIKGILERPATRRSHSSQIPPESWVAKKRDSIMVVAILIATMAFQAAVSPTGGVWQDDTSSHRAGEAVMAFKNPRLYKNFIRSNTVAFVTSLSTILLLIIGLPFKYRFFMWALVVIMWVSVTAVGITYGASIMVATPKIHRSSLSHVIQIGIISWIGLMIVILCVNTLRLLRRLWKDSCHTFSPTKSSSAVKTPAQQ